MRESLEERKEREEREKRRKKRERKRRIKTFIKKWLFTLTLFIILILLMFFAIDFFSHFDNEDFKK